MNLREYYDKYGREKTLAVITKAGTNWAYAGHMIRCYRRPSVKLAKRLVEASNYELSFVDLLAVTKTEDAA